MGAPIKEEDYSNSLLLYSLEKNELRKNLEFRTDPASVATMNKLKFTRRVLSDTDSITQIITSTKDSYQFTDAGFIFPTATSYRKTLQQNVIHLP